jgi:hypothetical protein
MIAPTSIVRNARGTRPRVSIAAMMGLVALAAIACAAIPYLRVDPVCTLTAAALTALIPIVITRGRDRRLIAAAMSLAFAAALVAAAKESYSIWQRAASYRRLSQYHATLGTTERRLIRYFDQYPGAFRGRKRWQDERPRWMSLAEYEDQLRSKYDRAARRPWLPVGPDPDGP